MAVQGQELHFPILEYRYPKTSSRILIFALDLPRGHGEVQSGKLLPVQRRQVRPALAEPMGCVLNGVDAVHAPWMERALIFGAGPMGLPMAMALKTEGVSQVAFCDISESRLELAAILAASPRKEA